MNEVMEKERAVMAGSYRAAGYARDSGLVGTDAARRPEVPHQLDQLANNIAVLSDLITALDGRLSESVARPNAPETRGAAGQSPQPVQATAVGGSLYQANAGLEHLRMRVESLLGRLET